MVQCGGESVKKHGTALVQLYLVHSQLYLVHSQLALVHL